MTALLLKQGCDEFQHSKEVRIVHGKVSRLCDVNSTTEVQFLISLIMWRFLNSLKLSLETAVFSLKEVQELYIWKGPAETWAIRLHRIKNTYVSP